MHNLVWNKLSLSRGLTTGPQDFHVFWHILQCFCSMEVIYLRYFVSCVLILKTLRQLVWIYIWNVIAAEQSKVMADHLRFFQLQTLRFQLYIQMKMVCGKTIQKRQEERAKNQWIRNWRLQAWVGTQENGNVKQRQNYAWNIRIGRRDKWKNEQELELSFKTWMISYNDNNVRELKNGHSPEILS